MRDCSNNRAGFDRVLMAVAATFITVAAGSTVAHAGPSTSSPADMAIDAAIPRPEPANVPPPTAADFKHDTTASTPAATAKPADVATAPATDSKKPDAPKPDTAKAEPASTEPAKTEPAKTDTAVTTPAATPPAAPAAEPVKAASNVPAADQPVADKLHDMFGAKSLRYFDRKAERAAVEKFYAARDFAPLWTQAGGPTANAKGVIARLQDAASDGLNAADYPVPDFAAATTPDALAEADLKLTDSMLDYARQAQSGRMHYSQVSGDIQYPEHPTDPTEVLTNITTAKEASLALDSYNPPQKLYRALKAKLAELRGQSDGPATTIAEGPALRYIPASKKQAEVVVQDPRVPELRAKLGIENADDDHYDAKVAQAVRKYQENADLRATGVLDDQTVKAINSPKRGKLTDLIEVNMERWRWLPRDLGAASIGDAYVILNIPDYTLKVMQHGTQVWTTRVVTGKPGIHATPLLTETMKYITVNPTWNVPPSIVYGEYLPALQQDPTVLQRMGLRLDHNPDGSVHISQPPGDGNALGRVRFNFPNKFLVYQHDTPDKYLFAKDERAFSHGCMRVQYPDQYAAVLLGITEPNEHYTADKIRGMYGRSEIDLKFPTPIPVNITYQTAFVDDAGKLQTRRDVYGNDSRMLALLRNAHGKDMENIVAHSEPSVPRPPRGGLPSGVSYASDTSSASQPSFFERLFGGPQRAAPAPSNFRRPPGRVVTR
jgi:L,D-transpeptidase YcbB